MGNGLSLPDKNLVVRRLGLPQNAGMDDPLSHSPRENVSRHMLAALRGYQIKAYRPTAIW